MLTSSHWDIFSVEALILHTRPVARIFKKGGGGGGAFYQPHPLYINLMPTKYFDHKNSYHW